MKLLLLIVLIASVLFVWAFPILIAIHKDNYWLIFLYAIWWVPSSIYTGIVSSILEIL